jgi:hypothetical protein
MERFPPAAIEAERRERGKAAASEAPGRPSALQTFDRLHNKAVGSTKILVISGSSHSLLF